MNLPRFYLLLEQGTTSFQRLKTGAWKHEHHLWHHYIANASKCGYQWPHQVHAERRSSGLLKWWRNDYVMPQPLLSEGIKLYALGFLFQKKERVGWCCIPKVPSFTYWLVLERNCNWLTHYFSLFSVPGFTLDWSKELREKSPQTDVNDLRLNSSCPLLSIEN